MCFPLLRQHLCTLIYNNTLHTDIILLPRSLLTLPLLLLLLMLPLYYIYDDYLSLNCKTRNDQRDSKNKSNECILFISITWLRGFFPCSPVVLCGSGGCGDKMLFVLLLWVARHKILIWLGCRSFIFTTLLFTYYIALHTFAMGRAMRA